MNVFADLPENIRVGRARPAGRPSLGEVLATLLTARYCAVLLHRCAAAVRQPQLAGLVKQFNQFLTGADVSPAARIGPGLVLYHPSGVVIGPGATIGVRCVVQQGVTVGGAGNARHAGVADTVVGDRVFLGAGSRVLGAIRIGNDVVVGANAVVTKSVPDDSVAVGVPAVARPRTR